MLLYGVEHALLSCTEKTLSAEKAEFSGHGAEGVSDPWCRRCFPSQFNYTECLFVTRSLYHFWRLVVAWWGLYMITPSESSPVQGGGCLCSCCSVAGVAAADCSVQRMSLR